MTDIGQSSIEMTGEGRGAPSLGSTELSGKAKEAPSSTPRKLDVLREIGTSKEDPERVLSSSDAPRPPSSGRQHRRLPLGTSFKTLLDTMDGISQTAIQRITNHEPLSQELEGLTRNLDEYYLRLRLWSNDIVRQDHNNVVSIIDALDIIEEGAGQLAAKLERIFDEMKNALQELGSRET